MSVWKLCEDELPENGNDSKYLIAHEWGNAGIITSYYDGWNCYRDDLTGRVVKNAEVKGVIAWCEVPEIDVELEDA